MKDSSSLKRALLSAGTVRCLFGLAVVATGSNIDPTQKHA